MIEVTKGLLLDEREIRLTPIRSPGPGGQHVNKAATAVMLRFDARRSPGLPSQVRRRLLRLAGSRLTAEGVIVIKAFRHRSAARNRDDAVERLVGLIRAAATPPRPRRPTSPSLGSRQRRLEGKRRRSAVKKMRGPVDAG